MSGGVAGPDWACATCGEPCPAASDACWSCGTSRQGERDVTFVRHVTTRLLSHCPACGYSLEGLGAEGACPECGRPFERRVADTGVDSPPGPAPQADPGAGIVARGLAGLTDLAVMFAAVFALQLLMEGVATLAGASQKAADREGLLELLVLLVPWLYFAGFESSRHRATPGKRLLGLTVTDLGGRRIGFFRATGRHVARLVVMGTWLVGYALILVTERRRALHDLLSGTVVVVDG